MSLIKFIKTEGNGLVEVKNVRSSRGGFVELITPDGIMLRFREEITPANFRNMIMTLREL